MNKIVNFDTDEQFNSFIQQKIEKELGFGSEGSCYSGKDGKAYKVFSFETDYVPEEIITTADIETDAFAFPETLFTVNGQLVAYTSKEVSPNLFSKDLLVEQNTIAHIDFEQLLCAYHNMKEHIAFITSKKIKIDDLSFNLLYDGKSLIGCDTCTYSWDESVTSEKNMTLLDDAMKKSFFLFLLNNDEKYSHPTLGTSRLLDDMEKVNVEDFLRYVEYKYKPKDSPKTYINKKSSNN